MRESYVNIVIKKVPGYGVIVKMVAAFGVISKMMSGLWDYY